MAEMKNSDQQMFLCWSEAKMPSFELAEQCKNKRRREHFDCRARLDYGTNPLCAGERSESNFQLHNLVSVKKTCEASF
jgi:hypothetical protein